VLVVLVAIATVLGRATTSPPAVAGPGASPVASPAAGDPAHPLVVSSDPATYEIESALREEVMTDWFRIYLDWVNHGPAVAGMRIELTCYDAADAIAEFAATYEDAARGERVTTSFDFFDDPPCDHYAATFGA